MAKINAAFLAAAQSATFNSCSWSKVGEPVNLKDIWAINMPGYYDQIDGTKATVEEDVLPSGNTVKNLLVPIKGSKKPIKLQVGSVSDLEDGDEVTIKSIVGQLLRKAGCKDIVRYEGELVE